MFDKQTHLITTHLSLCASVLSLLCRACAEFWWCKTAHPANRHAVPGTFSGEIHSPYTSISLAPPCYFFSQCRTQCFSRVSGANLPLWNLVPRQLACNISLPSNRRSFTYLYVRLRDQHHAPRIFFRHDRTCVVSAPHRIFAGPDLIFGTSGLSIDLVEVYRGSPS